jgi:hypothetical protein
MKSKQFLITMSLILLSSWTWGSPLLPEIKQIVKEQGVSGVGGGGDLAEMDFRRLQKEMYETFKINNVTSFRHIEFGQLDISIDIFKDLCATCIQTTDRTDGSLKLDGERKDGRNLPGVAIVFDVTDWHKESLDGKRQFVIHELLLFNKITDPGREMSRRILEQFNDLRKLSLKSMSFDCNIIQNAMVRVTVFKKTWAAQKIPTDSQTQFNLIDAFADDLESLVDYQDAQFRQIEREASRINLIHHVEEQDKIHTAIKAKKHSIMFAPNTEKFLTEFFITTPKWIEFVVKSEGERLCH